MATGAVIFLFTYLLIAGLRVPSLPLDRAAAAALGAVACVAFGVLSPREAMAAINGETLLLLVGLMGIGGFLLEGGRLERVADRVASRARTPRRLLAALIWGAGLLSALITNDAVCVLLAPVVVFWISRYRLPARPFLLALATAANTGSAATLVGNPQNMLCASLGGLAYRGYTLHLLPVVLVSLALNHGFLLWLYRAELGAATLASPPAVDEVATPTGHGGLITAAVILGTVVGYLAGADLAWTAVAGFIALMILHRVDPRPFWGRIDWSVIVFFAGLFVVVRGLVASGLPTWLLARMPLWAGAGGVASYARTAALFLVGSNVVSNVPFILVIQPEMAHLPDPALGWELLAMAATFAGNLTLLGSVANVIVAERGRSVGGLPFWGYLRVGLPLALVTTAVGTMWLLLVHGHLG